MCRDSAAGTTARGGCRREASRTNASGRVHGRDDRQCADLGRDVIAARLDLTRRSASEAGQPAVKLRRCRGGESVRTRGRQDLVTAAEPNRAAFLSAWWTAAGGQGARTAFAAKAEGRGAAAACPPAPETGACGSASSDSRPVTLSPAVRNQGQTANGVFTPPERCMSGKHCVLDAACNARRPGPCCAARGGPPGRALASRRGFLRREGGCGARRDRQSAVLARHIAFRHRKGVELVVADAADEPGCQPSTVSAFIARGWMSTACNAANAVSSYCSPRLDNSL